MEDSFNIKLDPVQVIRKSMQQLMDELMLENAKHLTEVKRIITEAYGSN